ncbi:MAG: membrane dipeptidase [Bryobacteraceae bacterium]|nr:membrane dipeptidase [Bryobacteraceae bacterium]
MRTVIRLLILLISALVSTLPGTAQKRAVTDAEVDRVHRALMIVDTHNDTTMKVLDGYDVATDRPSGSTDLQKLRTGNAGAVFFAAYVPAKFARTGGSAAYCRKAIEAIRNDIVGKHPGDFLLARTAAEIESARKAGKIAALIGIEGGHAIEDSLDKLWDFYRIGARYMTLTHTNTNNWADSSGDKPRHGGLNDLGRKVVSEMNRIGMIVDISHVSDDTFRDVLEVSRAPVFASHSSCRAISQAKRNMTDDMLRALGAKGGVIQINFACSFLNDAVRKDRPREKNLIFKKYGDDMDALRADMERGFKRATLADVVAHIQHAVRIAGLDHVGIGSDFDGIDCTPVGLEDYSKFPALTRALLEEGYSADDIRKIYGGNTLRLMREVEQTARSSQAKN